MTVWLNVVPSVRYFVIDMSEQHKLSPRVIAMSTAKKQSQTIQGEGKGVELA
jgi:hypothetical protein